MRYRQSLPCGTVEALEERLKQTKNMEVFRRIQCVYLRARHGYPPAQIAEITGYALGTVHNIHSGYLSRGEAIFTLGKPGGRNAAHMTPKEETAFLEPFIRRGDAGGIVEVGPVIRRIARLWAARYRFRPPIVFCIATAGERSCPAPVIPRPMKRRGVVVKPNRTLS